MLRTAFFITGLVGLLASAAVAAPTTNTTATWRGWGFRHHQPASQGHFLPVYATYRYHSRERHGLFGFLHKSNPTARHLAKKPATHAGSSRHKRTAGLF
ncbi:MAG: hypothetical protein EOO56_14785 [Hymenobacter sp.]|nr:MAG: hypothetical protein EOO56_14785 [Hymenobacter sp.]